MKFVQAFGATMFATDVNSVVLMVVAGLLVAVFIAAAVGAFFAASLRNRWQKMDPQKRAIRRRVLAVIAVVVILLAGIGSFMVLHSSDPPANEFREAHESIGD